MTRFSSLLVALVCFTFAGCGGEPGAGNLDAPDPAVDVSPVEDDLESAGMEDMTEADYLKGGKQE